MHDGPEDESDLRPNTAARLMRMQAEAILTAADRIDDAEFERAVRLVLEAPGKVVVAGAGKSGDIARKIAATLTSTGTPAVFLHPADALHGGLGIVDGDDIAIAISNSGETDELLALLPYLDKRKVPIVAIVGNLTSTLARAALVGLDASAEREACPFNLAPTSSTSVALAIGDALAIRTMEERGLTVEDFALNHPSGTLGRRLTLTVADILRARPVRAVVPVDAVWADVVKAITDGGVGAVTVEDDDSMLIGIITDGDLRRTVQRAQAHELSGLTAERIMTSAPVTVPPDLLAYDVLRVMEDRSSQISAVPVVTADGRCVGIVRVHDIVRSGV